MKHKLSTSTALILVTLSINAHAAVDFWAKKGVKYDSIIVKLKPESKGNDKIRAVMQNHQLVVGSGVIPVTPLFDTEKKRKENPILAEQWNKKYGFNRYFQITLTEQNTKDVDNINQLLKKISQEDYIDVTWPDTPMVTVGENGKDSKKRSAPTIAQRNTSEIPDFTAQQYYLRSPTDKKHGYKLGGINYDYAKYQHGGKGEGITVVSMEGGRWSNQHIDLPDYEFTYGDPLPEIDSHDTMSVGIMAGKDNGFGITGIANQANFAYLKGASWLYEIADRLKPGDVVQVGMQSSNGPIAGCEKNCYYPVDYTQAWFDDIKLLTDRGVHVISAAGNGNINLDHPDFKGKFDRAVRDSGSIWVGAVSAKTGTRAYFSSYGSGVTSASWGDWDVVTTTSHSTGANLLDKPGAWYTYDYSGTSSANPIVAGVVASISGIAKANGIILSPKEMRQLLSETGTKLENGDSNLIGTQPDLERAIKKLLADNDPNIPVPVKNELENPGAEEGNPNNWVIGKGQFRVVSNQDGIKPASGSYFFTARLNNAQAGDDQGWDFMSQSMTLDKSIVVHGTAKAELTFKSTGWGDGDWGVVELRAFDTHGNQVGTSKKQTSNEAKKWKKYELSLAIPANATQLKLFVDAIRKSGDTSDVHFDDFILTINK